MATRPTDPRRAGLPRRRRIAGWLLALAVPPLLTALLSPVRQDIALSSVLLLFLLGVVGAAAVGGAGPALVTAATSSLYANWYFIPPLHTWTIRHGENAMAFAVFVVVGAVVSWFVAVTSRRAAEAVRARGQAETLAQLAGAALSPDPLTTLAEHLRSAFELDAVAVLARDGSRWRIEAASGNHPPATPEDATETVPVTEEVSLALRGRNIAAEDRVVVTAFTTQLAGAVDRRHLSLEAAGAAELAKANDLRSALLAAVSHDLRTPLSSIKASVTSLLADDVTWSPETVHDFCVAIDEETDRLSALVANLLDMSRVTTGSLSARRVSIGVDEIVPAAIASLGDRARHGRVVTDVSETLPRVDTDPALMERALANLIDNAIAWSPADTAVRVEAGAAAGRIHVRVVDRGPGIPAADRARVFQPFQRLGDRSNGAGVGLGLAVALGFAQAVGGELFVEDTPGGGTTMVMTLPPTVDPSPT